jgi:hypothetical protein
MTFCLESIIRDGRLGALEELVSASLGGIAGDPGWELERRSSADEIESDSGAPWPPHTEFHARVEPAYGATLNHPECFMTRQEFAEFALAMLARIFADLHGKTVVARRSLQQARADSAPLLEKLAALRAPA